MALFKMHVDTWKMLTDFYRPETDEEVLDAIILATENLRDEREERERRWARGESVSGEDSWMHGSEDRYEVCTYWVALAAVLLFFPRVST